MVEPVSTGLAIVTDAVVGLPEPVKASFFKSLGSLIGGLSALPAAKLKQWTQGIDDTTAAKSLMSAAVAKAAADQVVKDSLLVQAAAETFLPTDIRKARNRLVVAQSAAERLAEEAHAGASGDGAAPPDDDWMNRFARFAEDASSERLQSLFGRILAGEILRPGAYGLATLRALSELDQSIANDFTFAWARSVGEAVDYSPEWRRGECFARWKRLSEAGLMAPSSTAQYLPPFNPTHDGQSLWTPMMAGGAWLLVYFQRDSGAQWDHIDFTRVGRELGSLLERPDYETNMRNAANRLPRTGLTRIELYSSVAPAEVLWKLG